MLVSFLKGDIFSLKKAHSERKLRRNYTFSNQSSVAKAVDVGQSGYIQREHHELAVCYFT